MAFWGIKARNEEQRAAMNLLLSDKPYLFLTGRAGTGKTLIAEAVGLYRVVERQSFRKLVYTRLQVQLGGNQGAIPGDFDEKTQPFIRPFLDNFELISNDDALQYLISGPENKRKIFFDPIQTLRGANLHRAFIMVDEAQNLDVGTIAALATRLGESSKMVFLGNFSQIDDAKLRVPDRNGLYRLLTGLYASGRTEFFDHINLNVVERNPAVDIIEKILRDQDADPRFLELENKGAAEWL